METPHPITPEVEEFVKWASKQTELENLFFSHILQLWVFRGVISSTTAELFDWWKLNIRK